MKIVTLLMVIGILVAGFAGVSDAGTYKYINGYTTKSGQYRSGHYRDVSNNGIASDNANALGMNN